MKNNNVTFSEALEALKNQSNITREGWNGKGMSLFLLRGKAIEDALWERYGDPEDPESSFPVQDSIFMLTSNKTLVPWVASQSDLLAEDWIIL